MAGTSPAMTTVDSTQIRNVLHAALDLIEIPDSLDCGLIGGDDLAWVGAAALTRLRQTARAGDQLGNESGRLRHLDVMRRVRVVRHEPDQRPA